MGITLGKDATVSIDSNPVAGVRNVTFTSTARTIDIEAYGSRFVEVYSTGRDGVVSMECNDSEAVGDLLTALNNGTEVEVSGGEGGFLFAAVITSITETAPIDGVVTFQVEAKMTQTGLRA